MHTPSQASTTTSAPSLRRTDVDTSLQKSTWPGESMRLTTYVLPPPLSHEEGELPWDSFGESARDAADAPPPSLKRRAIDDAFMVIPRCCSSSRLSR